MKTKQRRDAKSFARVERLADGGPPTAFLIWTAGPNVTDHGPTIFSKRSAKLLLKEQETRGNRYSMDVNHLSLNKDAPLENQRAVGFFSLEVRDGNLWAVDCEWSDTVRAGLIKQPPEWKYFSPAYDVDKETDEVVGFLNCALTNNPATHRVTALATRGGKNSLMKFADIQAALEGDDDEKKAAAMAAIKAAFGEESEDEPDPKKEKDAEEPEEKEEEKPKADTSDDSDVEDSADEDEPKTDATVASLVATVQRLSSEIAAIKKKDAADERKTLLASRPDFAPELVAILRKAPIALVRESVGNLPKTAKKAAAAITATATRGKEQGTGAPSQLPAAEKADMDRRMGITTHKDSVRREGNAVVFGVQTAEEARSALLASKGTK